MNSEEWKQVEAAFASGLELPEQERQAFWQRQFAENSRLKAELELLIRGERQAAAQGFLDKAAWSLTTRRETKPIGEKSSMIGKRIGEYEILSAIGSGGMGDVYLAKDRKLGREVALKIVQDEKNPKIIIRFLDEMRILSKIEHDNVARLYDSGTDGEQRPYIVMEYLRGFASLRDYLGQGGLPLDQVKAITRQFCTGLAQAHDKGIIHRDVKPENIMLINDRDGLRVKVIDFGVAIGPDFTPEELARGVMTRQATTFSPGTTVYKSPEQLENKPREQIKATSDVYSAALVIYEMLTGRLAYPSSEHRVHEKEFPPASSLRPEIGAKIDAVLQRALSKSPQDRQPDIRALANEVVAALSPAAVDPSTIPTQLDDDQEEATLPVKTQGAGTLPANRRLPTTTQPENEQVSNDGKSERLSPDKPRNIAKIAGLALALMLAAAGLGWGVRMWQKRAGGEVETASSALTSSGAVAPGESATQTSPQPVTPIGVSDNAPNAASANNAAPIASASPFAAQQMTLAAYRDKGTSPVAPDAVWRNGESVKFKLSFDRDGFLYLLNHGSDGQLQVLYPHHSVNRSDNRVAANQSLTMPPAGSTPTGGFRLDQQPGVETFYFIFAPTELNQDAMLAPIQSAIRELGNKPRFAELDLVKLSDWFRQLRSKAESLEMNAAASRQQADGSLLVKEAGILVKTIRLQHAR